MAMNVKEIETLIKEALPDAIVEIQDLAGDGNHYSATVTSSNFSGKSKIEQHKIVYNSLKGKKGVTLKKPNYLISQFEYLFSEDQGRYIVEIDKDDLKNVTKILLESSVHFDELGTITENELIIDDKSKVSIDDLIKSHTTWLTNYMSK